MQFESGKNLAGIGVILIFVSSLVSSTTPASGSGLIAIVGLILMLIGVKVLAGYYRDATIFNNMIYGVITGIVGVVVAIAVTISVLLYSLSSFLYKVFPGWNGDWRTLSGMTPTTANLTFSDIAPFIATGIVVFVILFISIIVVAIFLRRSLSSLKNNSGIGLFGTAGTIWLIGAFLTIILIGYLIIWFDLLLLAVAFFQLKPKPVQPAQTTQTTVPPAETPLEIKGTTVPSTRIEGKKYCSNCGSAMSSEAMFCPKCGSKQGP